jgi:enoyl-[acyl-carrier protein] reductase I
MIHKDIIMVVGLFGSRIKDVGYHKMELTGKKALIVGVANDQSIAWGVARYMKQAGAEIALTYLNEKARSFVEPLAQQIEADIFMPLNVSHGDELDALYEAIKTTWGRVDCVVHSIAFAPRDDLHGRVVDASAAGFEQAMDISVHSFVRLVRRFEDLMIQGGSIQTMSYYGAEKVVTHYNLMGPVKAALEAVVRELAVELGPRNISVNALSPGPIMTRAASGLDDFNELIVDAQKRSPMRRLVTINEVGAASAFLASDLARVITGSVLHIDGGRHIIG